jgi:hypothetical protein
MSLEIELITWSGCPSGDEAAELLERALGELHLPAVRVLRRSIEDYEVAIAQKFVGSPTFRVGGVEVFEPNPDQAFGLTCRVYQRPDGRFSPLPTLDQLIEKLGEKTSSL